MYFYIAIFVFWLLYKWLSSELDYFEKLGVPHEKPLPLVGNMLSFVLKKESLVALVDRNFKKFKKAR